MSEFKETGVGSRAWYIQVIKNNPDRSGFSFIRNENIDGYKLNYPLLKAHIEELTAAGYFQKQGKDDSPRVKYIVTSFGHRYLEQHKAELEAPSEPEHKYEKKEGYYYRDGKMISRLMVPAKELDKLDGRLPGPVTIKKPAARSVIVPPAPQGPVRSIPATPENDPEPVSQTPVTDTPAPASITPDTPAPEHHDSKSDEPTPPKNANSDNLVDQIYEAMGRLLLAKFKKKAGIADYANIDVHQLIEFLESES